MNWRSMKKWGILVALWLLYTPLAHAQAFMTTPEKLAFSDVSNAKYITARNKAETLLAENKDAIGATYVMALVYWEGEGNLLRSLSFLKKAIKLYEEKYCVPQTGIPKNTQDQMWHLRMLRELARIYSDLDDRQAEIDVRTRIAKLYNTSLGIDSVWALMKLRKSHDRRSKTPIKKSIGSTPPITTSPPSPMHNINTPNLSNIVSKPSTIHQGDRASSCSITRALSP